jgi:hypothetical protein
MQSESRTLGHEDYELLCYRTSRYLRTWGSGLLKDTSLPDDGHSVHATMKQSNKTVLRLLADV